MVWFDVGAGSVTVHMFQCCFLLSNIASMFTLCHVYMLYQCLIPRMGKLPMEVHMEGCILNDGNVSGLCVAIFEFEKNYHSCLFANSNNGPETLR